MREADLVLPQLHRTEMGVNLARIEQGIPLLIFDINAVQQQARRKAIRHRFHLGMCTQRTRQLSRNQTHRRRLHGVTHQRCHQRSAQNQHTQHKSTQYVQKPLH